MELYDFVSAVAVTRSDLGLGPKWLGKVIVFGLFGVGVLLVFGLKRAFPGRARQINIASLACGIALLLATAAMFNASERFLRDYGWIAIATLCTGLALLGSLFLELKKKQGRLQPPIRTWADA